MRHKNKMTLAGVVLILAFFATMSFSGSRLGGNASAENAPQQQSGSVEHWSQRCSGEAENRHCEVFQRLSVRESGQRLVEFAVGYPVGQEMARGVVILPLGILLDEKEGLAMQIDDGQKFSFKVRYCARQGCFAFLSLNDALLQKLQRGCEALFYFQGVEGKPVMVKMSLKGFTKALKTLS